MLVLMKVVCAVLALCQEKKLGPQGCQLQGLRCTDQNFGPHVFIQHFRSYSCSYIFKEIEIMIFVIHLCCWLAH